MGSLRRRLISIPAVCFTGIALVVLLPVWVPLAVLADLVRLRWRLPTVRLLAFGLGWAWLETAGVTVAAGLWLIRRSGDRELHYRLQHWWAANLMRVLCRTTGIRVEASGIEALSSGPVVMLCRHASLADSLVSAWVVTSLAHKRPRYVLKRELLADPCLDVVGNRLPNHFLDRSAVDSAPELAALAALSADMGPGDVAVIFPEGTRSTPAKRARALARIAERNPERAATLAGLHHLLPPRSAGSAALISAAPNADLVIAWHTGFDGLDTFGGILRHLTKRPPVVHFVARRISRDTVPTGEAFTPWLDQQWLQSDAAVNLLLNPH